MGDTGAKKRQAGLADSLFKDEKSKFGLFGQIATNSPQLIIFGKNGF